MTGFPHPSEVPAWVTGMIRYLGAAFPNWTPTAATGVAYYDVLRDVHQRHVEAAARELAREGGSFAPTAGTIRERAVQHRRLHAPHGPDCGCLPCIAKLPLAERWAAMSPAMRTMLEDREPEQAKTLVDAASQAGLMPAQRGALPTWTPRTV